MPTARKNLPAVDTFAPELSLGQQDVIARLFAKIGNHKVRVEVRSDSYDFQCYARVHVWREATLDWSAVHSIPHSRMKTRSGLYYNVPRGGDPSFLAPSFRADIEELLRVAKEILL